MYLTSLILTLIKLVLYASTISANRVRVPLICNGSPEWCRLRFDQYTFLGTHNSQAYNLELQCLDKSDIFYQITCNAIRAIPAINDCLYNNQLGHFLDKQLQDGIRALDLDMGLMGGKVRASHGMDDYVAYGDELVDIIEIIRVFLQRNPGEILVIEFGDLNGNDLLSLTQQIVGIVEDGLRGFLLDRPSNDRWPTLGEMVKSGKRVVVFASPLALAQLSEGEIPAWLFDRNAYINGAWNFTHKYKQPNQISKAIKQYCDTSEDTRWLGCDFEYSLEVNLDESLQNHPNLCIADASSIINPSIPDTANYCFGKKTLHRIRTDNYENGVELQKLIYNINKKNALRFVHKRGRGSPYKQSF